MKKNNFKVICFSIFAIALILPTVLAPNLAISIGKAGNLSGSIGSPAIIRNTNKEDGFKNNKCNATIDDNFSEDLILVVLYEKYSHYREISKDISKKLYSLGAIELEDLSSLPEECIKKEVAINSIESDITVHSVNASFTQTLGMHINPKGKQNVLDIIKKVEKLEEVKSAYPNMSNKGAAYAYIPDDPLFKDQWALNSENDIKVKDAWQITTGSKSIRVGVIDTGMESHEDLDNNLVEGYDFYNDNYITDDIFDNHGMSVSGVIGAEGNNGKGITGVAPNVKLVPLQTARWADKDGVRHATHFTKEVVEAINYATDSWNSNKKISILNYSVSNYGKSTALLPSISNYPGLFVWAAGNENTDVDEFIEKNGSFDLPNLICVGALTSANNRVDVINVGKDRDGNPQGSNYSSNGKNVHIYAPGIVLSTNANNGYTTFWGTSMAAPHVSGVAALMLSVNPNLTGAQLKEALIKSADVIEIDVPDPDNAGGYIKKCVKKLNAYKAVEYVRRGGGVFFTNEEGDTIVGLYNGLGDNSDLTIPSEINGITITAIGDYAFYNVDLTSVTIPNTIKSIGDYAFGGCNKLTSITIPNSVETMGENAFSDCTNLTDVTFEAGSKLDGIGNYAFINCTNLTHVKMDPYIESDPNREFFIGKYAFNNTNINSIMLPNYVTEIHDGAFMNCSRLDNVLYSCPSMLGKIGDGAFIGCNKLTSITIPNSVKTMGENAFSGCTNLTDVTFEAGSKLDGIGNYAFQNCTNLTYVEMDPYIEPDPNREFFIGKYAFNNTNINSIRLPNYVTEISDGAFMNCSRLDNVLYSCPSKLEKIGDEAFRGTALTSVSLPSNVKSIGAYSFADCANLHEFLMSYGNIGDFAFKDDIMLTRIEINENPDYTESISIGKGIIYGCFNINAILGNFNSAVGNCIIRDNVIYVYNENYGGYALKAGCNQSVMAESIDGKPVVEIADYAFYGMKVDGEIKISDSLKYIGDYAFYKLRGPKFLIIPEGVSYIGDYAFYEIYGSKYISIPESVKYIGEYSFYRSRADYMEILASVNDGLVIDNNIFGEDIWSDEIPFEIIGADKETYDALCKQFVHYPYERHRVYYDGLKYTLESDGTYSVAPRSPSAVRADIVIPYTHFGIPVTKIYAGAFADCEGLKSVILPSTIKEVGEDAFNGVTIYTDVAANDVPAEWNNIAEGNYVFWDSTINNDDPFLRVGSVVIRSDIVEAIEAGILYDPVMRYTERYTWMVYIDELGWETYSSLTELLNEHCPTGDETIRVYANYIECLMGG